MGARKHGAMPAGRQLMGADCPAGTSSEGRAVEEGQHIEMAVWLGTTKEQWHLAVEQRAPQPRVQLWAISQLRPPEVQERLLRISRIKTVWRLLRLRWQGTSAAAQLDVPELLRAKHLVSPSQTEGAGAGCGVARDPAGPGSTSAAAHCTRTRRTHSGSAAFPPPLQRLRPRPESG